MQLLLLADHFTQIGGDDRDRTGDPLLAKQVLSQLSYIPSAVNPPVSPHRMMVGLTGVEPVTSPLSGVRSNQLSYRPNPVWRRASHHTQKFNFRLKEPNLIGPSKLNSA
jgi:hypothetical protein